MSVPAELKVHAKCAGPTVSPRGLRGGNAASGRGAGNFVTETLSRLRAKLPVDASGRRTAFAGTADAVEVRLVVRRVRPTPGSQLALVEVFDHHAFIADLKGAAGLAHLPSSRFAANTAWLALVGLAYNLGPLGRGAGRQRLGAAHDRHHPHPAARHSRTAGAHRPPAAPETFLTKDPHGWTTRGGTMMLRTTRRKEETIGSSGGNNDIAEDPVATTGGPSPGHPSHTVGVCLDLRPLVPL